MFDPIKVIQEYLRFPSVSTDPDYKEGMEGARSYMSSLLESIGCSVEVVKTPLHPIIMATLNDDSAWPHVIIYGHYDVQPADPFDLWTSPPFEPEIRGNRIYARGAADNKGPLLILISAVARLLEKYEQLPLRITFLIEGEEETGSPSFGGFLKQYKDRLQGDFLLLSDTGCISPEQIVITTGLRGVVGIDFEVTGSESDLHSGFYGGAVLNPIQVVSEICASLHNEDGTINIDGFYDNVRAVPNWEIEELKGIETSEEDFAKILGVKQFYTSGGNSPFEAVRFCPTLEFNGIGGGYQGEGNKTIIPAKSFAKITSRLVADQKPEEIIRLISDAIKERCPPHVSLTVKEGHGGSPYLVVPPDRPNSQSDQSPALTQAFRAADSAISNVFGKPPLYLREGGSIPIIADLKNVVGLDSLMLGFVTPNDNIHAPNESFNLDLMGKAIDATEQILASIANL
jgi:acetylornithine deacetylase/succinyl-diaminopimelate desuccinylase-like protein